MEISKENLKKQRMFLSFFVCFFILGNGKFFDEKDIKNGDEELTTAHPPKSHRVSEKKNDKWCQKMSLSLYFFFDENTYIQKKKTIISSIFPHHRYINWSIEWWRRFRRYRRTWRSLWRKWKVRATWSGSIARARSRRCSGSGPWPSRQTSWQRQGEPKAPSRAP